MKSHAPYLILLILLSSVADAAEWAIDGTLNPSVKYDDNVFMSANKTSSVQYSVSPTLSLSREQDNNQAQLSFGYAVNRYKSSLSYLDRQDPFLRFNSGFQTERSDWGLGASYTKRSSRSTAVEDTGDFSTESTVTTKQLSPSYSYKLTERDSLSLGASYSKRTYSTSNFSDNKTLSLNTGWDRKFTERLTGGLNFSISNYQSTGLLVSTDYDNYNLSSSVKYKLSEIWALNGSLGIRRLESTSTDNLGIKDDTSSSGLSLNVNATRTSELGNLSFGLSRTVSPTSSGTVNETDRVNFSWSKRIAENVSTSISSSYQETSSALLNTDQKRKNLNFSPAISWQFQRNLGLNLAYTYRLQKQSLINENVSSNAVILTLNYDWDGLRVSR